MCWLKQCYALQAKNPYWCLSLIGWNTPGAWGEESRPNLLLKAYTEYLDLDAQISIPSLSLFSQFACGQLPVTNGPNRLLFFYVYLHFLLLGFMTLHLFFWVFDLFPFDSRFDMFVLALQTVWWISLALNSCFSSGRGHGVLSVLFDLELPPAA